MNGFDEQLLRAGCLPLTASDVRIVQVNVGLMCNQKCSHCHLACSPDRAERMDWPTMEAVRDASVQCGATLVDITGGEPSLHPLLRRFIQVLGEAHLPVQVRTNFTGLLADGNESLPQFLRDHDVRLVGSMPCYLRENVDAQRGGGVYDRCARAIRLLNELGYGHQGGLQLNMVYNPAGPDLPPDQAELEEEYRRELRQRFDIEFTSLLTIANVPIGRFGAELGRLGQAGQYAHLLRESFNPLTLDGLMCRHQVSVRWDGTLFDCDFNMALGCPMNHGGPSHLYDLTPRGLLARSVVTGDHCFACTAGSGSSCGGSLV